MEKETLKKVEKDILKILKLLGGIDIYTYCDREIGKKQEQKKVTKAYEDLFKIYKKIRRKNMDLDKQELRKTREQNGADTKIVLDLSVLDTKIKELEQELEQEQDNEKCSHISGKIRVLKAIKNRDIANI